MAVPGLRTNPKFLRLARVLGSAVLARGVLETLWDPCYEAGDPYVGTSDDIEALCQWTGVRGALTAALLDAGAGKGAGFIEAYAGDMRDTTATHYQVHDLFPNAPPYVLTRRSRERERNAQKTCQLCGGAFFSVDVAAKFCGGTCRMRAWRRAHREAVTAVTTRDVTRTFGDVTVTSPNVTAVPVRVRTLANEDPLAVRTLTNEDPLAYEDRQLRDVNCTAPLSRAVPAPAEDQEPPVAQPHQRRQERRAAATPPDDSPVVLAFPVVGTDGSTWLLREAQIARWTDLYPGLDVVAEARQALAWISAASSRRKTGRGMLKFLVAWFNRSVDSTRSRGPTLITGSLKTAGNRAAINEFLRRRGIDGLD